MFKKIMIGILIFVGVVIIAFSFKLGGLEWQLFFKPKEEEVKRKVFEETKSYVQGKIQDLAKYHEEYQKAETEEDKEAIKQFIQERFSDFDADNINSVPLRNFLIKMRGF